MPNSVNKNGNIKAVAGSKGKNVVVMSLEEYNSIQETIYLNSTPANRARLETALARIETTKPLQKSSLTNEEHRLVYMVREDCIYILQCRFRY